MIFFLSTQISSISLQIIKKQTVRQSRNLWFRLIPEPGLVVEVRLMLGKKNLADPIPL